MNYRQKKRILTGPLQPPIDVHASRQILFKALSRPTPSVTALAHWLNNGKERNGDKTRVTVLLDSLRQVDDAIVATGDKPLSSNGERFRQLEAEIRRRME